MAEVTKEDLNRAGYKYYAFISYNHRDEKWAKALQSRLRRYRLPSVARTELGGDIRIDPVFRYKTNLPVAHLREQIKEELERSKHLIVICSPNSAKPNIKGEHWVNDEVTRFVKLGRVDRIVPVIVDGVPNSGDDRECFCPALRETEISAVNLVEGSRLDRKHEFLRLVAKLLGIDPAQLIREDCEDERRDRIKKFLCRLPLILLALVGGIFAWDALRLAENYYADYVDSYGLPEGIFPLAKDELHGRHIHYRFEYRGIRFGKSIHADSADWSFVNLFGCQRVLRRVVQSNSAGRPRSWEHTEYSDRSPILEFTYDTDGVLRQIVCRASSGAFQRRLVLSDGEDVVNGIIELKGEKSSQAIMESIIVTSGPLQSDDLTAADNSCVPPNRTITDLETEVIADVPLVAGTSGNREFRGARKCLRSDIAQYQLRRDALGRTIERRFRDVMGYKFVSDSEGVYGFSYKLDNIGRTEELWYLDVNGDRRENKKGVAGRKYHYIGRNMNRAEYVNAFGAPTFGHAGWMVCVEEFDAFDNSIYSCFYDSKGKKDMCADGYSECHRSYDERGNEVACHYYLADGKPCVNRNGYAECRYEYDAQGHRTECRYYWIDGKLCANRDGYAKCRYEYDAQGYRTGCRYYWTDGWLCLHKDGYAGWSVERDMYGNVTKCRFFNEKGDYACCKHGYAGWDVEYDMRGNETRRVFVNAEERPILGDKGTTAEYHCEYDMRGNEIRRMFFDSCGYPLCGYNECRCEYDVRGNKTACRYYWSYGTPFLSKDGSAGWIAEYDAHGNETRCAFLDVDGKLTVIKDGYAEFRCEYDLQGNKTAVRYYGVDGKLKLCKNGYAEFRCEYDSRGNRTAMRYYGTDGKPCFHLNGCAGWISEYDVRGNVTEFHRFGTDGKLCLGKDGCAGWIAEYNERGLKIRHVWVGVDGRPTIAIDGCAEYRCEYDRAGNVTTVRCYGVDGNLTLKEGLYAVAVNKYGWDNKLVDSTLLDKEMKPVQAVPVVVSIEILEESPASIAGVHVGDIWCEFGGYRMRDGYYRLISDSLVDEFADKEKSLTVARKVGNVYKIQSFDFAAGRIGILFGERLIKAEDLEKIQKTYREYLGKSK